MGIKSRLRCKRVVIRGKNLPKRELGKEYFRVFTQPQESRYQREAFPSGSLGRRFSKAGYDARESLSEGRTFPSGSLGRSIFELHYPSEKRIRLIYTDFWKSDSSDERVHRMSRLVPGLSGLRIEKQD